MSHFSTRGDQPLPLGAFSAEGTTPISWDWAVPMHCLQPSVPKPTASSGVPRGSLPFADPPGHGGVHGKGGVRVPEATSRNGVHGLSLPTKTRVSGEKKIPSQFMGTLGLVSS